MVRTFCFLITMLCLVAQAQETQSLDKDSVLRSVDKLKALVDKKYWSSFNAPQYALEMNYYEDGPFRMHLVANGNDSKPRMECSSPEVTFKSIPDVTTHEEWYAMLIYPMTETNEGTARYIEYCLYQELGIEGKADWRDCRR